MDATTLELLNVLRDLMRDGVLEDLYGVDFADYPEAPLEVALSAWSAEGFPDLEEE